MNEKETIRAAMSALGKRKSKAKTAAGRSNLEKARAKLAQIRRRKNGTHKLRCVKVERCGVWACQGEGTKAEYVYE